MSRKIFVFFRLIVLPEVVSRRVRYLCFQDCAVFYADALQHTATQCNTLQHIATRCNALQHTATHCNTLQHIAMHCNTLQHTATHCFTPVAGSIFGPLSQTHFFKSEFRNGKISKSCFVFQVIQVISSAKFSSAEEVELSFIS